MPIITMESLFFSSVPNLLLLCSMFRIVIWSHRLSVQHVARCSLMKPGYISSSDGFHDNYMANQTLATHLCMMHETSSNIANAQEGLR